MRVRPADLTADGTKLDETDSLWWLVRIVLLSTVLFLIVPVIRQSYKPNQTPATTPAPAAKERTAKEEQHLFWHKIVNTLFLGSEAIWAFRRGRRNLRRKRQFRQHLENAVQTLERVYPGLKVAIAQPNLTLAEQEAILKATDCHQRGMLALEATKLVLQYRLPLCETVWRTGRQTQRAVELAQEAMQCVRKATRTTASITASSVLPGPQA